MEDEKRPIYFSPLIVVICLVFLAPLGIFLMWKGTGWGKVVKVVVTVASLLFFARVVTAPKTSGRPITPTATASAPTKVEEAPSSKQTESTPTPATVSPSPAVAVAAPRPTSPAVTGSSGSKIEVQPSSEKFEFDRLAGRYFVEAVAENTGDTPVRLTSCTFRIEGGEGCEHVEDAHVQLQLAYKVGKGTKSERLALLAPMDFYGRLAQQQILVPGGSAELSAKIPLRKLKECNPSLIEVRVRCQGVDEPSVEGWPPTSPVFVKGAGMKSVRK